jgi:uncharacterized protein YkwD
MKRLFITSVCTLVLSLLGVFGANQNSMNLTNGSGTNSLTTDVVENVTNIEDQQSLPSDNQINAADAEAVKAVNIDKADAAAMNNVSDNQAAAKQVSVKTVKTNSGSNYGAKNGQKIYYKNVNLSGCKSAKDVVKVLQNNGYTGITMDNIKNIKSLKDILAIIQANNGGAAAPTTKPAPTVKPAPTTKPVPTTKPAPTTKPTPTTKPAPTTKPTPTTTNPSNKNFADEVLRLVNVERAKAGLSAYTTNSAISAAANKRAQEISKSFSHTRTNGTSFSTVLTEYGVSFRTAGENIAYGQKTPQEVVTGWMNSPGHRANILNANFNKIGIGVYQSGGVIYWTQEFTN